jgi:hypothetical protein
MLMNDIPTPWYLIFRILILFSGMIKEKVLIMGAGIQGVCCALALSNNGIPVILVDKTPEPLLRSGLRNEGKIHLGLIYANDKSFRSAALMLNSALNFAPMVESFLGYAPDWSRLRSRRFNYLILNDTLLSPDNIREHYERLQNEYEKTNDPSLHYLGLRPQRLWTDTHLHIPQLNQQKVQMCIPTEEYALNLVAFRQILVKELYKRDNIEFAGNHTIHSVARTSYGFSVTGKRGDNSNWSLHSPVVVNCLWENRLYIDRQLGLEPGRKWVYRLKNRILGVLPPQMAALESFTCVLGPYGDIVNYNDHYSYLSWYPECMTGWSSDIITPESWETACNGGLPEGGSKEWVKKALAGLDDIFPGLAKTDVKQLDGGIIFSWGKTDIDDMQSELHNRFEIGIQQADGYYSIDTGKFTSAPYFAHHLQKLLQ